MRWWALMRRGPLVLHVVRRRALVLHMVRRAGRGAPHLMVALHHHPRAIGAWPVGAGAEEV